MMTTTNDSDILKLEHIDYSYPGADHKILDDFAISIEDGESVGLTGPIGSGKTTIFHIALGIIKPQKGTIWFNNRIVNTDDDVFNMRKKAGLVFQNADDQLFCPTVLEDVAFGPLNLGLTKAQSITTASETLGLLGLEGFEEKITHKLSGGEKKLVAIATILAMKPELILLDEPINNLDSKTCRRIVRVLKELEISKFIISHNLEFLKDVTDRVISLS
jgi:cobalt/nickel transport system ATP-binding protein